MLCDVEILPELLLIARNFSAEMKLLVAVIYSNFTTTVIDDDGIEAIDAYTVRPTSNKLVLKFERA